MFHTADPYDLLAIHRICNTDVGTTPVTVVLIDVHNVVGNDLPLDVLALTRQISRILAPSLRTILIKSKVLQRLQTQLHIAPHVMTAHEDHLLQKFGLVPIFAAANVTEYRAAAERILQPGWRVLEIGCHFGTSTGPLHSKASKTGGSCMGVDISSSIIKRARAMHPEVAFDVCDAWDLAGLHRVVQAHLGHRQQANDSKPERDGLDMLLLDVGGLSSTHGELDTISLVRALMSSFSPTLKAVVVKSFSMRTLAMQLKGAFSVVRARSAAPAADAA